MFKELIQYLNPMAHLGEMKYPLKLPFFTTIIVYLLLEFIGYVVWKHPDSMGDAVVFSNFALVLYFSFRSAIKGGLIVTVLSILYYVYFIYTRHASLPTKEMASIVASLLTITNIIITLIIGWHRQTIDKLMNQEIHAKEAAEHERRRLQTLLEQLPVGVIIAKAPTGEIMSINKQAQKLLGHSSKQVLSLSDYQKFTAFSKGKKLEQKDWPISRALQTGKIITGKEIRFTGTKKEMTLFVNAAPITDKKGNIVAAVSTFFDITLQKALEQQKDDFIAMASHELRTPLTSTKMYSQLLLKEFTKNPKAIILIKKLGTQIDKLTKLVMTMLDTTQLEQGKLLFEAEPFYLRDIALETVNDLQHTTKHKLLVDWKSQEYILGNKEKISQVFTNLVTNAIKYSPDESDIIINSRKKDGSIIVSVQDFGTGIPPTEQKHIFDRFYQSKQHKTYSGLGLGLYISSEIIKQHGGKMWVKSEKGKGSTFYFTIPTVK